jgi:NADPH:quinone reductase-like Zn-dependent oxidoreductase
VLYDVLEPPCPSEPTRLAPDLSFLSGPARPQSVVHDSIREALALVCHATASPRRFELVRSLGAEAVVDYADPVAAAKQVREAAPKLDSEHTVDCVGEGSSTTMIAAASLNDKETIAQITSHPIPVEGVKTVSSITFHVIGKVHSYCTYHDPSGD